MSVSTMKPSAAVPAAKPEAKRDLAPINGELLKGVKVAIEVRLGEAAMTVEEMMALKSGSVVSLSTGLADHVELLLNGTFIARGEIVAVGDKYGVRIVEIAPAP
jgi:flagellar motor switch protein FliN